MTHIAQFLSCVPKNFVAQDKAYSEKNKQKNEKAFFLKIFNGFSFKSTKMNNKYTERYSWVKKKIKKPMSQINFLIISSESKDNHEKNKIPKFKISCDYFSRVAFNYFQLQNTKVNGVTKLLPESLSSFYSVCNDYSHYMVSLKLFESYIASMLEKCQCQKLYLF